MPSLDEIRGMLSNIPNKTIKNNSQNCSSFNTFYAFNLKESNSGIKIDYTIDGCDAYIITKHGLFPNHFRPEDICKGWLSEWAKTNISMIHNLYDIVNIPMELKNIVTLYVWK